jgi:hypothetical protein
MMFYVLIYATKGERRSGSEFGIQSHPVVNCLWGRSDGWLTESFHRLLLSLYLSMLFIGIIKLV